MKLIIIILSIVLLLVIITIIFPKKMFKEGFKSESRDNMLFTAYNTKFVCSKWLDYLPKHMRLSRTGNPMYTSHVPPKEGPCYQVKCPLTIVDDITPSNPELIDHYDTIRYGTNNSNLTCWQC